MDRLWRYSVWISSRLLVCSGLTGICSARTGLVQAPNMASNLWRQRHQVASCLFDFVRRGDHQKGLQLRHGEGEGTSNDSRVYGKTLSATMTWPLKPAWLSENPCVDLELLRIKHSNRAADLAWEYNSHIQSKYQGTVPIFTDGSKDHKTEATGAAVVIPGYQVALSKRTPDSLSVCAVELFAVLMALQWSERSNCGAVLICSDSVSALTSIKTGTSRGNRDLLYEVLSVNSRVARQGKRVAFMWVPAHSGISGNERADKLAKEAVRRGEVEFMASQARLESSLRRSASLGLEVLERASRRSVDWTSVDATPTSTPIEEYARRQGQKSCSDLDEAFASIAELMAQTTCYCRRFYSSGSCSEPSDTERNHVSRFHRGPAVEKKTQPLSASAHTGPQTPPPPPFGAPAQCEDFYIEVSPGSYAVTASLAESQQQTHLVCLSAGESIDLTFNL